MRLPLAVLLVTLGFATVSEGQTSAPKPASPKAGGFAKVGEKIPVINAVNPDGNAVDRSHFKGKVVLLAFWTLDPVKKSGMPLEALRALRMEFKSDRRFLILTVCIPNSEDDFEDWGEFVARQGRVDYGDGETRFLDDPKWWNAYEMDRDEPTTSQRYGVADVPAYFLIGGDGRLTASNVPEEGLQAAVEKQLRPLDEHRRAEESTAKARFEPFLGFPEDEARKFEDENPETPFRGIVSMTAVQPTGYKTYRQLKKAGRVIKEEFREDVVLFAVENSLHVPFDDDYGAYLTITERYRARVPGRR